MRIFLEMSNILFHVQFIYYNSKVKRGLLRVVKKAVKAAKMNINFQTFIFLIISKNQKFAILSYLLIKMATSNIQSELKHKFEQHRNNGVMEFQYADNGLSMDFFCRKMRYYGLFDFSSHYLDFHDMRNFSQLELFAGFRNFRFQTAALYDKKSNDTMTCSDWKLLMERNKIYKQACLDWYGENYVAKYYDVYSKLLEGEDTDDVIGYDGWHMMVLHVMMELSANDDRRIRDTVIGNFVDRKRKR